MSRKSMTTEGLAGELARLPALDRAGLIERWRELYGSEPPASISQLLMQRAIAYRMQEKVWGGLDASTRRFLAKVAEAASAGRQIAIPQPVIKSGTRLLREWHGITYEVAVTESGVLFQGKQYKSLSEVARIITGVKWSGPLFFGLKRKAQHDQ